MRHLKLAAALLLAGCPAPRPRPAPPPPPPAPAPPPAWAELDTEEARTAFMQRRVLPRMREVFTSFDRAIFPEVSCQTCHRSPGHHMPDPRLPRLSPDGRFDLEFRHSPELTMFMYRDVVPVMRSLLGDPDLDCFTCHLPREAHFE